ncbi:hypothetical protein ALP36_05542, partial [Pseudomonas syringae pv. coriandricola]
MGQRLRCTRGTKPAHDRRFQPCRAHDRDDQHRPVRQPGQPVLRQQHRDLAERAIHVDPAATAELRKRLRQTTPDADAGQVSTENRTQSVQNGIPTRSMGTMVLSRTSGHSHAEQAPERLSFPRVVMHFVTLRVTRRFCGFRWIEIRLRSPFRPSATYFDGAK